MILDANKMMDKTANKTSDRMMSRMVACIAHSLSADVDRIYSYNNKEYEYFYNNGEEHILYQNHDLYKFEDKFFRENFKPVKNEIKDFTKFEFGEICNEASRRGII